MIVRKSVFNRFLRRLSRSRQFRAEVFGPDATTSTDEEAQVSSSDLGEDTRDSENEPVQVVGEDVPER